MSKCYPWGLSNRRKRRLARKRGLTVVVPFLWSSLEVVPGVHTQFGFVPLAKPSRSSGIYGATSSMQVPFTTQISKSAPPKAWLELPCSLTPTGTTEPWLTFSNNWIDERLPFRCWIMLLTLVTNPSPAQLVQDKMAQIA